MEPSNIFFMVALLKLICISKADLEEKSCSGDEDSCDKYESGKADPAVERFIRMYSDSLFNSVLYKESDEEDQLLLANQIKDLQRILDEDTDIVGWIREIMNLSDKDLSETLNLFFSGNLRFLFREGPKDELPELPETTSFIYTPKKIVNAENM